MFFRLQPYQQQNVSRRFLGVVIVAITMRLPIFSDTHASGGLLISEIYADGNDEWIELINTGPNTFSGLISLSGAKATPVILPLTLAPHQTLIIGDAIPGIIDPSCVGTLGLALQINDNSAFTVQLRSGSILLDTFIAPNTPIKRASIQRQWSGSTLTTQVSDQTNSSNTHVHIDASPCLSPLTTSITPTDRSSLLPSDPLQGLIFSEFLWDGSAEYIEILNQGPTDFSGPITILGIDIDPRVYTVTIPAFQTLVIAHSSLMTGFSSGGYEGIRYQNDTLRQRIRDDQRLTAILYIGSTPTTGTIRDMISIPRSTMLTFDNQTRSWEKIRTDTGWMRDIGNDARITGRVQNPAPHKANPGFVRSVTGLIIFPRTTTPPPLLCDQSAMIEEIHRDDSYVSNYVDIVITTGFVGSLSLSGGGVWATWTGTFSAGQHLLVSQSSLIHPFIHNVASIDFSPGTILYLYRNNTLIDNIIIGSGQGTGQSLYAGSLECGRSIDTLGPSTPFMPQSLFPLNPKTEVTVITSHPSPPPNNPPSGGSCPQCPICQTNENTGKITDSGPCLTGVNIVSTLSTSPIFINAIYQTGGIHRISLTNGSSNNQTLGGYSLYVGSFPLHTRMTGILTASHSLTHDLPASPRGGCYHLFYLGVMRSTLCFDPQIHGNGISCHAPQLSHGGQNNTGGTIIMSGLRLIHVDYAYPAGQPQAITLSLHDMADAVHLGQYRLRVNQNTTRLTITGATISPGSTMIIWKNFNFPRVNPTTIHLLHLTGGNELLIDSYFYDPSSSSPLPSLTGATNPSLSGSQQPALSGNMLGSGNESTQPLNPDTWDIRIQTIDYAYPSGQPQSITLILHTGAAALPLSQFRLRVNQNQTRLTITGATLFLNQPLTIWRSFNFPRTTPTTVHLLYLSGSQEIPLTSYFYDPSDDINEEEDDNIMTGAIIDPRQLIVRFENIIWDTPAGENQHVTLRLFTGADRLSLSRLRLRVNDNKTRTTLGSDDLILGSSITVTKNFRFPKTQATTVHLLYVSGSNEVLLDTYMYQPQKNEETEPEHESVDLSSLVFRIKEIVYDPPGGDTGNEVVIIEYLQGPSPLQTKNFRLRINGSTKTLEGDFVRGDNRFQKTFGFPNTKKTCIELIHTQSDKIFDTLCYDPEKDSNEEMTISGTIELRITSLVYDVPPRTDQRITILYAGSNPTLSLTPYSLLINGRRRLLRNFGSLQQGKETELIGNFGFLKTKDTCVSLAHGETIFDTRCYSPAADQEEKKNASDLSVSPTALLTIDAVMPNPQGKDDNEQIHLRLLSGTLPINLFDYFLLTDKGKRITIRGTMTGETIHIIGSFGLPNTASCLTLFTKKTPTIPMARLCYPDPKDTILYDGTQAMLFSTTKTSPYRLTYSKGIICLYINNKKTECFDKLLEDYHRLRLATQYINELESELIYTFPTLRFYSRLHPMAVLYRDHVGLIDQKIFTVTRRGVSLPVSSFGDHYDVHYGQRMEKIIADGIMKLFE